jgi:hypothetical protein
VGVERGVAEWIAEARCWVLRNRARLTGFVPGGLGLFLLGHGHTREGVVGGWGRPSINRRGGSCSGCVVSLGLGFFLVGVGLWLVFLPVF